MITKFKIFESDTYSSLKTGDQLRCIKTFGDALAYPDIPKINKFFAANRIYNIYNITRGLGFKPQMQYYLSTMVRYKGGVEKEKRCNYSIGETDIKKNFVLLKDVETAADPYGEEKWEATL